MHGGIPTQVSIISQDSDISPDKQLAYLQAFQQARAALINQYQASSSSASAAAAPRTAMQQSTAVREHYYEAGRQRAKRGGREL